MLKTRKLESGQSDYFFKKGFKRGGKGSHKTEMNESIRASGYLGLKGTEVGKRAEVGDAESNVNQN